MPKGSRRPIVHGTNNGYEYHRCKCSLCREAHRIYVAKRNRVKRQARAAMVREIKASKGIDPKTSWARNEREFQALQREETESWIQQMLDSGQTIYGSSFPGRHNYEFLDEIDARQARITDREVPTPRKRGPKPTPRKRGPKPIKKRQREEGRWLLTWLKSVQS